MFTRHDLITIFSIFLYNLHLSNQIFHFLEFLWTKKNILQCLQIKLESYWNKFFIFAWYQFKTAFYIIQNYLYFGYLCLCLLLKEKTITTPYHTHFFLLLYNINNIISEKMIGFTFSLSADWIKIFC